MFIRNSMDRRSGLIIRTITLSGKGKDPKSKELYDIFLPLSIQVEFPGNTDFVRCNNTGFMFEFTMKRPDVHK